MRWINSIYSLTRIEVVSHPNQWKTFSMNSFCLPYFPYETLASIQKRIFRERAERRKKKINTQMYWIKKKPKENLNWHEKQTSQVPTQLTIHGICTWFWAQNTHTLCQRFSMQVCITLFCWCEIQWMCIKLNFLVEKNLGERRK